MFKKIFALLLAAALLGSTVACSMPDTIFAEDALSQEQETEETDAVNLYDFTFTLGDQAYELPMSYSALSARGWKLSDAEENADDAAAPANNRNAAPEKKVYTPDTVMEADEYSDFIPAEMSGTLAEIRFHNSGNRSAKLSDCDMVGIKIAADGGELHDFKLVGDVALGSRYDSVLEMYGKPSYIEYHLPTTDELAAINDVDFIETDDEKVGTLYYTLTEHSMVSFELGDYQEQSSRIVCISLNNDVKPERKYDYSKDLKITPKELELYNRPSLLGKKFSDFAFKYEGNLYTLPIPVQKLVSDGWVFVRGSAERVPIGTTMDGVIMRKGNMAVSFMVHNYDMKKAQTPINCFAVSLSASVTGPNVSLLMPKGITLGSSEEDLVLAFGKEYAASQGVSTQKNDDEEPAEEEALVEGTERFYFPESAADWGCYLDKTVTADYTVYSIVMADDVPSVTLPVSITDIGDTGANLLGDVRKHIDMYVDNRNHKVVKAYMQNCPEYIVNEAEILEQQMLEAEKKAQEEKEKEEAEKAKNN